MAHGRTQWRTVDTLRKGHTVVVGIAKKNLFSKRSVGMHYKPYGGKTGRAMIKYPHIQKNAQRKNTLVYPGLTTVSLDRIITYMKYYYVMCQKGASIHRAYVQLDPGSADVLHDSLEQRYDLVQVCAVRPEEVDPDILIK